MNGLWSINRVPLQRQLFQQVPLGSGEGLLNLLGVNPELEPGAKGDNHHELKPHPPELIASEINPLLVTQSTRAHDYYFE